VAAPPAREERDALAVFCIIARLRARRHVGLLARRRTHVFLAFGRVTLLVAIDIIFQIICYRIVGTPPSLASSAEVTAPPVGVERDALAQCCIHA